MGEVYRAKDSKLKREVALKVLPESLSRDLDAFARFEREAQAVAALSHPNILSIHDFGDHDGRAYAVSELLHGETLRGLLDGGLLPVRKAIDIARQICTGLAAAHAAGIVHRDLKPDNVFVTDDGRVKILDFGLAKTSETRANSDQTHSPTVSAHTEPGTVMGTVGYMSPEQVKGLAVDERSDIFSFGAVLYEMLAGRRAFQRDTTAETMTAILREEPPESPSSGTSGVSPALDRIVRHCLEKKPEQRFQSASDIGFALETSTTTSSGAAPAASPPMHRGRVLAGAALLLAVAVAGWFASAALRKRASPAATLAGVSRFSHDAGISEWPTWSPDGSLLAFASNRTGNFEIYVRRVDGGQEINVTNDPAEDFQPAFSPDGKSIAFVSTRSSLTGMIRTGSAYGLAFRVLGGDLWVAPALGGQARLLAHKANAPAWDPSGKYIAYVSGPEFHRSIQRVPLEGGEPETILETAKSSYEITRLCYSPNGTWISFETAPDPEVFLIPSRGGSPRSLLSGASNYAWDTRNHRLVFLQAEPAGGTRIELAAVDEVRGKLAGRPTPLTIMMGNLREPAVASDGLHIAISEVEGSMNLTRLPLNAEGSAPSGSEEPLSLGHVIDRYPAISPDGRRIAYASDRLGGQDLWMYDRQTKRSERIELPGKDSGANQPHWAPDGRSLTVSRLVDVGRGTAFVWRVTPDGSQAEKLTTTSAFAANNGDISPDGGEMLFEQKVEGWDQIFAFEPRTRRERQITTTPGDKFDACWSPDGKWVAFTENAAGSYRLARISSTGGKEDLLTTSYERLRHPFVSRDGKWVYVQPSHRNIWRVRADGGPMQQVTRFPESGLFIEEPTISPDGSFLAYCRSNGGSSLWILSLADVSERR
jgi:Tol biopolymer transport system component